MNTVYRCSNCQAIGTSFGMTCPKCGKAATMRVTGYTPYETRKVRCPKCSSKKYDNTEKKCPDCKYVG